MTPFIIIQDQQEKHPFLFRKEDLKIPNDPIIEVAHLKTGDYSIKGFESDVCIERKSIADLFGSCGTGHDRVEREFQRMAEFKYAAFVVEADWHEIYTKPPNRSRMSPKQILRIIMAWHMRYNVHIWACPGRKFAEKITYLLLDRFYRDQLKGAAND